jgi:hypothetical protein
LSQLLGSAKQSAKDRGEKGREDAGVFDITLKDLEKKFEEQDGTCYYSGMDLRIDTRAWKVSLERKDPSLGYTYDNTVLCCLEFNHRCQWSSEWIRRLVHMVLMKEQGKDQVELETFDDAPHVKKERAKVDDKDDTDGNKVYKCKHCAEYKHATLFNEKISNGCKACQSKKNADTRATPRGAMQQRVDNARERTERWKKKSDPRGGDADFELSLDILIEVYYEQEGRCAYSGLPFDFGTKHQKPSLERRDPLKPYTRENVCLVWMAWNTADHASYTKHNVKPGDHQGWNETKFELAFSRILEKVKKEFEDSRGGAAMTMEEFKIRFIAEYESNECRV